jgi:hypothetical protein
MVRVIPWLVELNGWWSMGLEIGLANPNQKGPPFPLKTYLKLTCDGNHRGFCDSGPPSQKFTAGDFIKDYATAMKAGWKEIHNSRRMFLCPSCSGKSNNG